MFSNNTDKNDIPPPLEPIISDDDTELANVEYTQSSQSSSSQSSSQSQSSSSQSQYLPTSFNQAFPRLFSLNSNIEEKTNTNINIDNHTNDIDNLILKAKKETDDRFISMLMEQTKSPVFENVLSPSIIRIMALKEFKTTILNVCKLQNFPTREEYLNIIESALFLVFSRISDDSTRLLLTTFLRKNVRKIDLWQTSMGFTGNSLTSSLDERITGVVNKLNNLRIYSLPLPLESSLPPPSSSSSSSESQNPARNMTRVLLSLLNADHLENHFETDNENNDLLE